MSPTIKAILFMVGAIASFSTMAVAGRAVSFELDTFEIMMYRSFVGIAIVLGITTLRGGFGDITRRHLHVHALRNLFHFGGQNLWFFAVTAAPLAQVFALEFTSPIWVLLLAPLVLGERLTTAKLISAALGFIGILIVARPFGGDISLGIVTAALSAIGFAVSILLTKRLTRTETITCVLFYLTFMQAVFGVVCAGFDGDIALPGLTSLPWIILIGCAGLLAHFCLTSALSLAPATLIVPVDFARLPVIAIIGMAFYGEDLDIYVFVGALIIFAGNYLNIWTQSRPRAQDR